MTTPDADDPLLELMRKLGREDDYLRIRAAVDAPPPTPTSVPSMPLRARPQNNSES